MVPSGLIPFTLPLVKMPTAGADTTSPRLTGILSIIAFASLTLVFLQISQKFFRLPGFVMSRLWPLIRGWGIGFITHGITILL
jgi:hypothetical protein